MASTAKADKSKKTTTKKTSANKTTKTTNKQVAPSIRTDINEAGSWPFPVYSRS